MLVLVWSLEVCEILQAPVLSRSVNFGGGATLLVGPLVQTATADPSSPRSWKTHTYVCTLTCVHNSAFLRPLFSLTMFAELEIALIIYKVNFPALRGPAKFKHKRVWREIPRAVRRMSGMEREISVSLAGCFTDSAVLTPRLTVSNEILK